VEASTPEGTNVIQLDKYEVIEEVGRGGVAVVYRGRHKLLHNDVAVKVLHQEFTHDEEFVKRFVNGARSAARLKHSNIIPVFDVGEEQSCHYIVMEFLRGETLDDRIKRHGPYGAREMAEIIRPLAAALEYAHGAGIIHRDIKSPNIFIKEDGTPVLTDFDIAKATDLKQNLTLDGSVLGTPAYMSPEQARGEPATAKSDIYSLGVIMYEMATGELPFKGENTLSVLRQIAMDDPRPPSEINASVSPDLQELILWCMEKAPEDRPERAGAIFAGEPLAEAPAAPSGAKKTGKPVDARQAAQPAAGQPPAAETDAATKTPALSGRAKRLLIKAAVVIVALGAAYLGIMSLWHALERRDFNVVSLFSRGGQFTGTLPEPSAGPAKLDEIAVERVKRLYGEAAAMTDAGNIDGAIAKLETIRDVDPGNRLAQRGMQKIYNWHIRNADAMFKKGDYRGYRRSMDGALAYFPEMKRDNLYQRGKKYSDAGRLLGDGEDNAAAVYATIIRSFPDDKHAEGYLLKTVDVAMRTSFAENRPRESADRALRLAATLPEKAPGILGLAGDIYYANNVLLSRDGYGAASMYARALEADSTNAHARQQLIAIAAEIKNRLAGMTSRDERRALVRTTESNFPDTGEFQPLLRELEALAK
jgi:tRNA A-37 threonylcarbamoyl transferase component Bud32